MLWGRRAGGCKCRAANRLYVLSLTPGGRSKRKCCLATQWEFLPPDKSVSLEAETTHYFFWEVRLVVFVVFCFEHNFEDYKDKGYTKYRLAIFIRQY